MGQEVVVKQNKNSFSRSDQRFTNNRTLLQLPRPQGAATCVSW